MIALLFIWNLMAQDVLVQGVDVSDIQFEKKLMTSPKMISYSQFLQNQKSPEQSDLLDDFKRAQFEFLKGSFEKSKKIFQSIGERQHQNLWPLNIQKIIHYSFLRTAQLDPKNANRWLRQALIFHPDLKIDRQLFPPPLVEQYESIKKSLPLQVWSLPKSSNSFSVRLINGRPLGPNSQFFKYRSGSVRLDFVSNRWQPIKIVSDLSKIEDLELKAQPLARGTCHAPRFQKSTNHKQKLRLFDGACVSEDSKPLARLEPPLQRPTPGTRDLPRRRWYRNKWLWVGVSVVATGLAVHSLNQQNRGGASPTASNEPQEFTNN